MKIKLDTFGPWDNSIYVAKHTKQLFIDFHFRLILGFRCLVLGIPQYLSGIYTNHIDCMCSTRIFT